MADTTRKLLIKRIVIILISLALFIGAFSSALYFYQNDGTQRSANLTFGDDKTPDRIDVTINLLGVDPIKSEINLRFAASPEGSYAKDARLTKELKFFTGIESGKSEVTLEKNRLPESVTGSLSLEGKVSDYPFDRHTSDFYLFFTNPKDETEQIPMVVNFYGAIPGYNIDVDYIPKTEFESSDTYIGLRVNISRSVIIKSFSLFVMMTMWLVGLVVFTMTMTVVLQPRPVELGMFTFIAAMLFAVPAAVRPLQPGVPPVGGLSDFLSFFWAESLIAVSMPILFFTWLTRYKKPS